VAETAIENVLQITSSDFDERFYQRTLPDGTAIEWAPSVTHALGAAWPPSFGLTNWIGDVGNERADQIKRDAGEEGSYVHNAIEEILNGGTINNVLRNEAGEITANIITEMFPGSGRALKIKRCMEAFHQWLQATRPQTINVERVTWLEDPLCAGTVDYQCLIDGVSWTIDFKSSKSVHDIHRAQVALYQKSEGTDKAGILHLGNQTKRRWSFLEVKPEQWLERAEDAIRTFHKHNPNAKPSSEVFPDSWSMPEEEVDDVDESE
tara:strand:+ start:126 stop:917 length:792 start_codon:yes stop_codon:yes gene_type:complete